MTFPSNFVYDNSDFWLLNNGGGGGGTGTGATAAQIENALGENFVFGHSSIDSRTIVAKSTDGSGAIELFEQDGVTAVADGSNFIAGGPAGATAFDGNVKVLATDVADLIEANEYTGTLTPGTYTRANILALAGGTQIIQLAVTVATGTADINQGGAISNLTAGAQLLRPYRQGFAHADFTLTVDAGSSAFIEVITV